VPLPDVVCKSKATGERIQLDFDLMQPSL